MKNMKYIYMVLVLLVATSCKEYLEAPAKSTVDESVLFSSVDLTRGAVDGIKVPFGQTNSYRGRFLPWYGMNTDIEWYNSSNNGGANGELVTYAAQPSNTNMNTSNNAWAQMYTGIERANQCIRGIRLYGNPEPGNDMGYLLGEAITLRAVYYADLLKAFGDVVARFEPITSETLYLPKTNRDEIYKVLLADLEEAATLVPWPNQSTNTATTENINKAFVKGLRARLALVAGGYSQYTDGVRLSNDPALGREAMYTIALEECKSVIESGSVGLNASFEELWRKYNSDDISAGGESLWEIPFSAGRGRWLFTFAVRHRSPDQYTAQPRGGQAGPTPFMYYDYDVKDLRQDVSCVPYEWGSVGVGETDADQQLTGINTWAFGKYRYEWKNVRVTSTNDDGTNYMYMRYAEILLMAAEAANELQGPSAAAPYLRQIRQRAFDPADWSTMVDGYINSIAGQAGMFDAIVREHKLEFCGEMLRKQALIRWNLLKTKLDEAKTKMYALRSTSGEYADVPQTIYYQIGEDGESLDLYGLERGETEDRSAEYAFSSPWAVPEQLEDDKIETIYTQDPNANQFWPIWQVFIDASNGQLVNDL